MSGDTMQFNDAAAANLGALRGLADALSLCGTYHVKCYDKDGNLKWEDVAKNLVTDVGAKHLLDNYLGASAFTATCYMGLKGAGLAANGDTQGSHAGWSEQGGSNAPTYTGNRKTVTFSVASGSGGSPNRVKASTGTYSFAITSGSGVSVDGAFLNINGSATKDDTSGTLFSVGQFTGGARSVSNGDTLTVTYQLAC
jgi:hypothetical protein